MPKKIAEIRYAPDCYRTVTFRRVDVETLVAEEKTYNATYLQMVRIASKVNAAHLRPGVTVHPSGWDWARHTFYFNTRRASE